MTTKVTSDLITNKMVGGVVRTLESKLLDCVSVKDFGAVGDGVADDTLAIQAAIDNSTGLVHFGELNSTYKVSRIVGRSNLQLLGKATLDFSNNPNYASDVTDPLIKIWGTAAEAVLCTSNVLSGATSITVGSTSGIVAGDIIELATPGSTGGFEDTSITVHNGELLKVLAVPTATTIELAEPVLDASGYTVANNAQVRKLNTVDNIVIGANLTIKGKGRPQPAGAGDTGVVVLYGRNCKIHCSFEAVDSTAVRLEGCYDYEVSGAVITHSPQGVSATVNYGVVPSGSSKHGRVFNCTMHNMRHAVVTSHLSSALGLNVWGVVRCLAVHDNTICNTWHAGIATHSDAEYVDFYNNTLVGCFYGVNIRERNAKVRGNTMVRCNHAVYLTARPMKLEITNNTAYYCTGSFVITSLGNTRDLQDVVLSDNTILGGTGGITITLAAPASAHKHITIERNVLNSISGGGGAAGLIRVTGAAITDSVISGNTAYNCTGTAGVVINNGATRLQIMNNHMKGVDGNSFLTQTTYTNSYGKMNTGTSWSGSGNMTNTASILTDNTFY